VEVGEMRAAEAFIIGLILMAICIAPSQSQYVNFKFTCEGTDSTMSSYSYVKEPSLEDSGYTRGLKTGSFNYLDDGDIIFSEKMGYDYGNGSVNSNSSVYHELDVDFNGTRGISEFYGKGFFKNNRAISAWKKIRYEDLERYENVPLWQSRNGYSTATLGKTRTSKNFSVDAEVSMSTGYGEETFTLLYVANVTDGVVETKDATGWSNRTGARRVDFEHDTMMSGEQLNITNELRDSAPWAPAAGPKEDWLSCCIGGSEPYNYYPSMDINDSWPNDGTYATLQPAKKVPNVSRTQNCIVDPFGELRCSDPKYEDFSCNDTNCTGFECIYQFATTAGAGKKTTDGISEAFANITQIFAIQSYQSPKTEVNETGNITRVTYNITVKNVGSVKLKNVTLNDTLPLNMAFSSASYPSGGNPTILGSNSVIEGNDTIFSLVLSLGDLDTSASKLILLNAWHDGDKRDPKSYQSNRVHVFGEGDKIQVKVNYTAQLASPPDLTQTPTKPLGDGWVLPQE
jgi:uncharacterized repeat protein (TIGR01451 family)